MSRIERVSYRSGFVKRLREAAHLPAITFEAADLPEDVVALVDAHLLDPSTSVGLLRRAERGRPDPVRRGKQEVSERVLWQPPLREAAPPGIASRMFLVLPKEPHSPGNGIAVSASPMPTPPMISTHRQKPAASACSGLSATATPSTLSYERYGRSRSTGGRLGDHDQRSVTGRGHALPSSTSCSTMRGRGSEVRDGTW